MKQIAVISGKGGTGKTTISSGLVSLIPNKVVVDCDVDAANLHLTLSPQILEEHNFLGGKKAVINKSECLKCNQCFAVCRFAAIHKKEEYEIDKLSCVGCASCSLVCPAEAIALQDNIAGKWFVSKTAYGLLVHAELGIAEDNSGKLIAKIRDEAKKIAEREKNEYIIIDGPPGIGCPVISTISGVDYLLIVTEPSLSSLSDLKRVVNLVRKMHQKTGVCINKYNLNLAIAKKIEDYCDELQINLISKIPFHKSVVQAAIKSRATLDFYQQLPDEVKKELEYLKSQIFNEIN